MKKKIDSLDLQLLSILGQNLTPNFSEVAKILNTSPSTIYRRVNELKRLGVIKGFNVKIDYSMLGKNYFVLFYVKLKEKNELKQLKQIEGVEEILVPLGEWDAIIKVRASNIKQLSQIDEKISNFIISKKTEIVLKEL
ncbi:MAG: Lrp/AsnC family transcriptional regulator [Candidatus Micrarchaeia archaeon]